MSPLRRGEVRGGGDTQLSALVAGTSCPTWFRSTLAFRNSVEKRIAEMRRTRSVSVWSKAKQGRAGPRARGCRPKNAVVAERKHAFDRQRKRISSIIVIAFSDEVEFTGKFAVA